MSLENLLRIGKLKAHAADEREIDRLLQGALVQVSLAALLAKGYRPATSEPGHHQLLIQALSLTAALPPHRVQVLEAYRKARNQSGYRGVPVSDVLAHECVADTRQLLAEVRKIGL